MANQPVAKHPEPGGRLDPRDSPPDHRRDDLRQNEADAPLVMPLAEPALGEPLVGATSVIGDHIEDGERDPHTIAEEQRIRSAAHEAGLDPEAALEEARRSGAAPQQRRVAPPVQHQAPKPEPHVQQQHHGQPLKK